MVAMLPIKTKNKRNLWPFVQCWTPVTQNFPMINLKRINVKCIPVHWTRHRHSPVYKLIHNTRPNHLDKFNRVCTSRVYTHPPARPRPETSSFRIIIFPGKLLSFFWCFIFICTRLCGTRRHNNCCKSLRNATSK